MLKFMLEEGKPVTEWRLTYVARVTSTTLINYLQDMERYDLVKRVHINEVKRGPRKYGEVGHMSRTSQRRIKITAKGQRFLSLTQDMAALLPTAPWILENDF